MEITTVMGCKVNCTFCPQKALTHTYFAHDKARLSKMSLETFRTCLDKIPASVKIHFSGMAEPWLNKNCTEMLLYAAQKGHSLSVYTTLVGLTDADFTRIQDFPYDHFVVHIADSLGNSHIPVTPEYLKLLQRVLAVMPERLGNNFKLSCHGPVHPDILATCERHLPDVEVMKWMFDRAGNVQHERVKHQTHQGPIQCGSNGKLLNHNVLLPDGSVWLCCMDYALQHPLGNLLQLDYSQLFTTPEAQRILAAFDDDSLPLLCRNCHVAQPQEVGALAVG